MTTTNRRTAYIFREADGYHYCDATLEMMDARGTAYRSIAATVRAIADGNTHREDPYTHFQRGVVVRKLEVAS